MSIAMIASRFAKRAAVNSLSISSVTSSRALSTFDSSVSMEDNTRVFPSNVWNPNKRPSLSSQNKCALGAVPNHSKRLATPKRRNIKADNLRMMHTVARTEPRPVMGVYVSPQKKSELVLKDDDSCGVDIDDTYFDDDDIKLAGPDEAPTCSYRNLPEWFFPKEAPREWVIDYEVRPSKIGGYGIFAKQDVPKGSLVWKETPALLQWSKEKTLKEFAKMSITEGYNCLTYCYVHNGVMNFNTGDGKYVNHSHAPSHLSGLPELGQNKDYTYAIRDIHTGEEITEDYREYEEPDWYLDLCQKYGIMSMVEVGRKFS